MPRTAIDWRELCALRMTRTLARQPRKKVSRDYLASLPKREAIVVSPDEFGGLARAGVIAEPPAPPEPAPTSERKDRLRPRRSKTSMGRNGDGITDHVLLRYLERVIGVDMDAVRATILDAVNNGTRDGDWVRGADGNMYAIAPHAKVYGILTVLTPGMELKLNEAGDRYD